MAKNPDGNDQQKLENAINELTDRKNDITSGRPSTSLPQKRPSPNVKDGLRYSKRLSAAQKETPSTNSSNSSNKENKDESKGDTSTNDESVSNEILVESSDCDDDDDDDDEENGDEHDENKAKAGQSSRRAIESPSKWYSKPMPLSCKKLPIKPNPSYLSEEFIAKFKEEWTNAETNSTDKFTDINGNVKLYNKPFKICLMQKFLQKKVQVQRMVYEMCQMEWQRKQMDLYEFHQSIDLVNISALSKPNLKKFYNMMSNEMLPWMRKITGLELTHISASCSMYNYSDYLLVHDDMLSDRQIAFVYYLSPWFQQWTDDMGGALELFECDANTNQPKYPIVEKFPPRNDQFVFFRVCKESFHQVGEVTNLVYPRLTINGWFHGPSPNSNDTDDDIIMTDNEEGNNLNVNDLEMLAPLNDEINLSEWIDPVYLGDHTKESIQKHIEDKSEASLELFLIQDFFDLLLNEFKDNTELNWILEGPANQQKYETLQFSAHSTGPPKDLYTLFASKSMFGLLHEYTALDFDGSNAKTPSCSVKICRFTQGSYTLLGSSSTYNDSALEVILFFGAKENVGKITYLNPSEDPNGYNTTGDIDATSSSMDVSESYINNSSIGNISSLNVGVSSQSTNRPTAASTATASTSKSTGHDSSSDMSLEERSSNIENKKPNKARNSFKQNSRVPNHRLVDSEEEDDSDSSSSDEELPLSDDELAHEESLLTIHPKDNSLNLVYRLAGQTKFIKYISKNALKTNEYVYILMATYKE